MERLVPVETGGIKSRVITHEVWGARANALVISLPEPRRLLSSCEGFREASNIVNCYLPKPIWPRLEGELGSWPAYLEQVLSKAGIAGKDTSVLSTGMNMDNLAWQEGTYRDLNVTVFVTAGVKSNAMRIGQDKSSVFECNGEFQKIGTINTIILTNVSLEPATMAASFITITEAKNIALQELDIRSSYTPEWQATGTGTDQIIIVSGNGYDCRYAGGHTKMGELLASTVTEATKSAIVRGLAADE